MKDPKTMTPSNWQVSTTSDFKEPNDSKKSRQPHDLNHASKPDPDPSDKSTSTKLSLLYDIIMLFVIIVDLTIISFDLLMMSKFAGQLAEWLNLTSSYTYYVDYIHQPLRVIGGFFTIFLIVELVLRWIVSIIRKDYSRWFFFPFVHWYEVIGCLPQFRALRLLRAFFIGRKLYQLGYQVLPESWINTGKFYYDIVFEEISDRVILTATDNIRQQFADEQANQRFMQETINKNRPQIQLMLSSMLKQELAPQLVKMAESKAANELSVEVGRSIQDALSNTPELRRYLRMIPIAGGLIESQIHTISQNIGQNLTQTLLLHLTQSHVVDDIIDESAHAIANIDLDNPELEKLIESIINDGLTAFEQQVKVQQWKHQQQFHL